MSVERKIKRREERKFVRISVRYGQKVTEYKAIAQQISSSGFFLLTNTMVYLKNTPVVVEITGPAETWIVTGIVRHAIKVHPSMIRYTNPGMGVELMTVPPACRDYLISL